MSSNGFGRTALGVLLLGVFALWEPDLFHQLVRAVVALLVLVSSLSLLGYFVYMGFDSVKSGVLGINSALSAPELDPGSAQTRIGAVVSGTLLIVMTLGPATFVYPILWLEFYPGSEENSYIRSYLNALFDLIGVGRGR